MQKSISGECVWYKGAVRFKTSEVEGMSTLMAQGRSSMSEKDAILTDFLVQLTQPGPRSLNGVKIKWGRRNENQSSSNKRNMSKASAQSMSEASLSLPVSSKGSRYGKNMLEVQLGNTSVQQQQNEPNGL